MMLYRNIVILSLLLILFIDGLGLSIVLPLSTELFLNSNSGILSITTPIIVQNFVYGANLVLFSGGMFFGAPILGELSDKYGRKNILYLALLGTLMGYLSSGIGILVKSPSLFLFGRLIDGLTAGSIPIAQACMSDMSSGEKKAGYIGFTLFAVTAGYIFGPLIAKFIVIDTALFGNGLALPFFFTATLTLFCIILLTYLNDTSTPDLHKKIHILKSLNTISLINRFGNLKLILLAFFFFQLGWTLYFQYLPVYLKMCLLDNEISYVLAIVGFGMSIAFCFLVSLVQKYIDITQGIFISCLIISLNIIIQYFLYHNIKILYFTSFLGATGYGIGYSFLLASLCLNTEKSLQGLIMGLAASMSALASSITALLGSVIINYSSNIVIWLSAIFLIFCGLCIILRGYFGKKSKVTSLKANY
ncbi:MFS transporter [Candidatus Megaera polyxenophila]|nr:MFS transporter [Candidatus Megaera polyxenophila]